MMLQTNRSINITGHRGACGLAPENTLASIKMALAHNIQRIEVDVQQTKDNILILLHDTTIDRTTTGKGTVGDLTYHEILQYNAGEKFSAQFKNELVPTLQDAFALIGGQATLVIEIKLGSDHYPSIEKNILDLIETNNAHDWTAICSFDDNILNKIRTINNKISLHKLMAGKIPFLPFTFDKPFHLTDLLKYQFADEISVYHRFVNNKLINKVHKMNKKINVWTVNDAGKAKRLMNMGVDGLITDYPDKINVVF